MGMKGIWVLALVCAFVAGSIMTGTIAFAHDDDDLNSLLCPIGQVMTGILFEDEDEILEVICNNGAGSPEIKHFTTTETSQFITVVDSDVTPNSVISFSIDEVPSGLDPESDAGCSATVDEGSFTLSCVLDELGPGSTINYFVTNP